MKIDCMALCVALSIWPVVCFAKEPAPTYQGEPVPPIEFDELQFTHDVLKEKVRRLNSLAGGMHLPHEIPWSRRGPSESDARKQHDYLAQWSTHKLGVTAALQPKQRPGMRVLMILDIDPKGDQVWRFYLSTDWRPEHQGWNCDLTLHSWKPYRPDDIGAEELSIRFGNTDGKSYLHVPSSGWWEVVPAEIEERKDAEGVPLRTTIIVFGKPQTTGQMQALVASPDSFLAETLRALDTNEAEVQAGIAASHRIYLAKRVRIDVDEWDYVDVPTPDDFTLTAAEQRALTARVKAQFDEQRQLIRRNYEDMYPTMLKAFPIDKYFARQKEINASNDE